jgi:hypothetical protein
VGSGTSLPTTTNRAVARVLAELGEDRVLGVRELESPAPHPPYDFGELAERGGQAGADEVVGHALDDLHGRRNVTH